MKFMFKNLVLVLILMNTCVSKCIGCSAKKSDFLSELHSNSNNSYVISSIFDEHLILSHQKDRSDDTKYCVFRNFGTYPRLLWIWLTSGMCYFYTDNSRLINPLDLRTYRYVLNNISYLLYVAVVNETVIPLDYTNENTNIIVRSTFTSEYFYQKWYDCSVAAVDCCENEMDNENIHSSDEYPCTAVWDGWSCYPRAQRGTTVEMVCPLYSVSASSFPCTLYSEKECFSNGTWNTDTDYTGCASAPVFRRRHNYHVIVLYVSIALSIPAVVIFLSYEKLRILRVNLHRNLLVACILRNVFTILSKNLVILDALRTSGSGRVMLSNGTGCKALAFFENAAVNAIYACMAIDGFYLHKLIVRIFSKDPNPWVLYAATLVLTFLPSTVWAIVRATMYDVSCWMSDTVGYSWIGDSVRLAVLFINFLLLIDICRVLLLKLQRSQTHDQTKSTLKAMIFLVPLFGVPFLITIDTRIAGTSCISGDIFYYFSYGCQALQGILVACIFCYFNKEVQNQLKGTYRKLKINFRERYGWNDRRNTQHLRRATATTLVRQSHYVPPNLKPETHNNKTNQSQPKEICSNPRRPSVKIYEGPRENSTDC